MDDVRAVMDAVGSERAALFGVSEGGPMCVLFAATYPERTTALVALRRLRASGSGAPTTRGRRRRTSASARSQRAASTNWGGRMDLDQLAPSEDDAFSDRLATYLRRSASPGAARRPDAHEHADRRAPRAAGDPGVPTLSCTGRGDRDVTRRGGPLDRRAHIPARGTSSSPATPHAFWVGDTDAIVDEIGGVPDRRATRARARSRARDRAVHRHRRLDRAGGASSATGAGASCSSGTTRSCGSSSRASAAARSTPPATASSRRFDGPARAIRVRRDRDGVRALGLEVRAGAAHRRVRAAGGKVAGIAVHTGARVAALAGAGEVLVSSTVQGPRRGLGHRLRRSRRARAEGRARRVAALRRRRRVAMGHSLHMEIPDVQYARSGDVSIAYQVVGDGPNNLVLMPDFFSNLVYDWEAAHWRPFYERLAQSFRLILFDKRGTGLSDRGPLLPEPRDADGGRAGGARRGRLRSGRSSSAATRARRWPASMQRRIPSGRWLSSSGRQPRSKAGPQPDVAAGTAPSEGRMGNPRLRG